LSLVAVMVDDATASCWLRRKVHLSHDNLSRLREHGLCGLDEGSKAISYISAHH